MQIHEGKIDSNITDAKLQELAIKTLVPQSGFPATLKQLLKPGLIQGIINAEAARWGSERRYAKYSRCLGQGAICNGLAGTGSCQ